MDFFAELRGKACEIIEMTDYWSKCAEETRFVPFIGIVGSPQNQKNDISAKLILMDRFHTSYAGTGAMCTAACSRINGSVVNKVLSKNTLSKTVLNIEHPSGVMPAFVEVSKNGTSDSINPTFEILAFVRTARRILYGQVYIPEDVLQ